ncbi:hypothetical protein GGR51DRAFT_536375 [Nemania sp. FL0031]|nr:hypothetical protein GGR51DRAFT_536375 [Nemania sp. FL0031]
MCDYTQVEYNCQHFRFVVLRWCPKYERTYKPCPPNVTHLEVRNDEVCCMYSKFYGHTRVHCPCLHFYHPTTTPCFSATTFINPKTATDLL